MPKRILPKSLRIKNYPVNYKKGWDFLRGARVKEKYKVRKSVRTSDIFEYKRTPFFLSAYKKLQVGKLAGVVICAKNHLYKLATTTNKKRAMRSVGARVFVGSLLNKSTNGHVHNLLLRCKIAKSFFLMHFELTSPNILAFFSISDGRTKAPRRSCFKFKYKENYQRRLLRNKYGSYNKR